MRQSRSPRATRAFIFLSIGPDAVITLSGIIVSLRRAFSPHSQSRASDKIGCDTPKMFSYHDSYFIFTALIIIAPKVGEILDASARKRVS